MKVEILGTGCKRCDQLFENTQNAVAELDSPGNIEIERLGMSITLPKWGCL